MDYNSQKQQQIDSRMQTRCDAVVI